MSYHILAVNIKNGVMSQLVVSPISETSGFPEGFRYRGYLWAAEITAVSHHKQHLVFVRDLSRVHSLQPPFFNERLGSLLFCL